jgi:hypothetical protein
VFEISEGNGQSKSEEDARLVEVERTARGRNRVADVVRLLAAKADSSLRAASAEDDQKLQWVLEKFAISRVPQLLAEGRGVFAQLRFVGSRVRMLTGTSMKLWMVHRLAVIEEEMTESVERILRAHEGSRNFIAVLNGGVGKFISQGSIDRNENAGDESESPNAGDSDNAGSESGSGSPDAPESGEADGAGEASKRISEMPMWKSVFELLWQIPVAIIYMLLWLTYKLLKWLVPLILKLLDWLIPLILKLLGWLVLLIAYICYGLILVCAIVLDLTLRIGYICYALIRAVVRAIVFGSGEERIIFDTFEF